MTINAALGGQGDIESAAYVNSYNPADLCQNYLGDTGVTGLGTTVPNVTYSFIATGQSDFVVVVNTTGTTTSSEFSGTIFQDSSTSLRDLVPVRHIRPEGTSPLLEESLCAARSSSRAEIGLFSAGSTHRRDFHCIVLRGNRVTAAPHRNNAFTY